MYQIPITFRTNRHNCYSDHMTRWMDRFPELTLIDAVRQDLDLDDATWDELEKAATAYQRRCAKMIVDPGSAPHGQESTYVGWGCRCDECVDAYKEARQARRAASVRKDFSEPVPQLPPAERPWAELTLTEKAVRVVERDGYDKVTQKARDLYDAWKSEQDDVI